MYSFLLVIIYLSFISLGLPDSLLGSAWPVMYRQLNVPMSYAGIITMIIAGGTIVSSLMSNTYEKNRCRGGYRCQCFHDCGGTVWFFVVQFLFDAVHLGSSVRTRLRCG